MSVKCFDKNLKKKEQSYIPHKLRSRPLRCISLPLCCLLIFIFYWFFMCPLIFVGIENQCKTSRCNWPQEWPYYFWIVALLLFILILSIILCLWCCKPEKEVPEKVKERQKEYDKLLSDAMDYNSLKKKEQKPINERILLKTITETNDVKPQPNKTDLELKPVKFREVKKEIIAESEEPIGKESMVEEIDKMFPRCSMRRKDFQVKRPDSLVLQSPKYPNDVSRFRHTMVEETKSLSPLTPRELFFFDLAKAAHDNTTTATKKFIDNEKKHSSNNYDRSSKPEIKSFQLKRQLSSVNTPEYFIANVAGNRSSCSEVFMYVDGGQPEEALTICYLDTDDEVFKE